MPRTSDKPRYPLVQSQSSSQVARVIDSPNRRGLSNTSAGFGFSATPVLSRSKTEASLASLDFLPTVNFDELQSSIRSDGVGLTGDAQSNEADGNLDYDRTTGLEFRNHAADDAGTSGAPSQTRVGRSVSFLHRQPSSSRQNTQVPLNSAKLDSSGVLGGSRGRRESQFQPNPKNPAAHSPRKSMGPGVLERSSTGLVAQQYRYHATASAFDHNSKDNRVQSVANLRLLDASSSSGVSMQPKLVTVARDSRTKPIQPPQKYSPKLTSHPLMTTELPRSPSSATAGSSTKSPAWNNNHLYPSTASKRLSVMPPHATGLGARTISPTDARRIKRMSMRQEAPPLPLTPPAPAPAPETAFKSGGNAQSPSLIPRKSVTPSSSRTTPDHSRKLYDSGFSTSSSNSYSSARTSSSSHQQPRLSQSSSTSRLPTPKPRNVHSSASGEVVPPVPAIPKAYESPKDLSDQPFFSRSKSTLPFTYNDIMDTDISFTGPGWTDATDSDRETRTGRGGSGISAANGAHKSKTASSLNKKHLQPLRLPPLNLLPLSTPTVAKVAALQETSAAIGEGRTTPYRKRAMTQTPSTPMTASKAHFYSKGRQEVGPAVSSTRARSSSSNLLGSSESASLSATSSSSSGLRAKENPMTGHQTMTPFTSSSFPKSGLEFNPPHPKMSSESFSSNTGPELRTTRLHGPRPRAQTIRDEVKAGSSADVSSPTDSNMPSTNASLRRKWSLSFRRSSSKVSLLANEQEADNAGQPPKYEPMPPPKLPASVGTSGPVVSSPSLPNMSAPHCQARSRQSSTASLAASQHRLNSDNLSATVSSRHSKIQPEQGNIPEPRSAMHRTTSSILSPMHRMLSSKGPSHLVLGRRQESNLDRDDLIAEEEMKKLASKRKDLEAAAHELDELRKRATPKDRLVPAQALRSANLNLFERGEIVDYKEVYFCGTRTAKKLPGDLNSPSGNFGYDDERGDYNIVDGDHLAYRYEIVDVLGKGSFGQVVRCVDHKCGGLVAIKIIRNKKRFHQQALVEVNILRKLREWVRLESSIWQSSILISLFQDPNNKYSMVSFTQSFYFRGHLCISTELLGMNLYEFIKTHDFRGFSLQLIRRFTKQMLNSLVLLHSHRIIHCDLKPENVLLAHPMHSEIRVIDFGSSCFESEKVYTYIQSRFYRSPEVILGMAYGLPIDIWSLGCILAELYAGYPIFPGENEQEQLACIMEVFGPPEKHLIEKSTRKKLFFDSVGKPRLTVSSKGRRRRPSSKSLQQALKCEDEPFLDFITRCLRWDPERRFKPEEALQHEFITGIKKPPVRTRNQHQHHHQQQLASDSTARRGIPNHTPSSVVSSSSRPLPDPPPLTSFKSSAAAVVAARNSNARNGSPSKPQMVKRHTTVNGLQSSHGVKRTSTGATVSSNLPRVTTRSMSNKGELATAAAAAATLAVSCTLLFTLLTIFLGFTMHPIDCCKEQ